MVEGDREDATGRFILYGGSPLERVATTNDLQSRKLFVPFQHVQHYKVISDNNFAIRKSRLKINLAFQNNIRKEYGEPEAPEQEELFFDLKTINYNLQWQLPELSEWHTTIGVNGMRQSNNNKGPEVIIPEYDLFDFGTFVFAQRLFKKSSVSGGFRFDHRSLKSKHFEEGGVDKFAAFTRMFSNFSGSIGISYEPSDHVTLKFNIARGFRSPSLAELGSNGVHEGTNRYEYGDNLLRSETSLQPDLGIDFNYEHFNIGITAFYNRINDFIFYRKLESVSGGDSIVVVDGENHSAFKFNQHDAMLTGLEITLDIHPHPLDWLHFEHALSFVRGKFANAIDGSNNLPMIPAMRVVNELRGDFIKAGNSFRNLYLKFEADNVFKQDKAFSGYNTETVTSGYTLFNAGAGLTIINRKSKRPVAEIHLSGTNLTNRSYQHHLSRLKYTEMNLMTGRTGVFNPGRNFSIKLNLPLSFGR
jgi:iron complex outermembrane recepter protein